MGVVTRQDVMERRLLGSSGLSVSVLGVGCWPIGGPATNLGLPMGWSTADDDASLRGLLRAFELGATLFDTADVYGLAHSERLLDTVIALPTRPLIVAGGSLTARNERLLLSRYPDLLVARGAGEPTIQDVLAYWHGDLERAQIRGVGYLGAARGAGTLTIATARSFRHTANVGNRLQTDILPELDLLDATFRHKGVAQLESSRGCTNYCSFCPRSHKGQWSGADPRALPWMLAEMGIFRRYPELSRTIYLVDEEFIGRDEHAVARALAVASTLHQAGFQRETSCRVDQVVRLDQDRDWRLDRAAMWRWLCALGLRRCLFGVESGVDSVLERFNKETTGEQNALAVRRARHAPATRARPLVAAHRSRLDAHQRGRSLRHLTSSQDQAPPSWPSSAASLSRRPRAPPGSAPS